jgi:hypothetical protein
MNFFFVETVDQALEHALEPKKGDAQATAGDAATAPGPERERKRAAS